MSRKTSSDNIIILCRLLLSREGGPVVSKTQQNKILLNEFSDYLTAKSKKDLESKGSKGSKGLRSKASIKKDVLENIESDDEMSDDDVDKAVDELFSKEAREVIENTEFLISKNEKIGRWQILNVSSETLKPLLFKKDNDSIESYKIVLKNYPEKIPSDFSLKKLTHEDEKAFKNKLKPSKSSKSSESSDKPKKSKKSSKKTKKEESEDEAEAEVSE